MATIATFLIVISSESLGELIFVIHVIFCQYDTNTILKDENLGYVSLLKKFLKKIIDF